MKLSPVHSPSGGDAAFAVRGERLGLRYPRPDDAAALYALGRDPQVTRYFSWGPYRAVDEARGWIATLPARRARGVALELAIVDANDRPVGITLLNDVSPRDRRCVVGTWLGREHWGTGVNRESKALVAGLAFGALGMTRLGAYADVRNARSQAALERVGFRREGVLRSFHRHGDEPRDVASYALLREDWRRSALAQAVAVVDGRPPAAFVAGAATPIDPPTTKEPPPMPTIIVQADTGDGEAQLCERVPAALMADPRAGGRLVERIAVALVEAERAEQNVPRSARRSA